MRSRTERRSQPYWRSNVSGNHMKKNGKGKKRNLKPKNEQNSAQVSVLPELDPETENESEPKTKSSEHHKNVFTAGKVGYEFDTDFTGDKPKRIKDEPALLFDGFEKERQKSPMDRQYEADYAYGVVSEKCSKSDLENLWNQKNDLLRQSIASNEKQLIYVKKRMDDLKFAVKFHIFLFIISIVLFGFLFFMKFAIWDVFKPVYIFFGLGLVGILGFYSVLSLGKSIRQYKYHVKKDAGWTKPHVSDPFSHRRAQRERNYKAEYEKVRWVLRQYDYEKELMFVIKMHIDDGELNDLEDLRRQLHDVFIYEEVVPAIK